MKKSIQIGAISMFLTISLIAQNTSNLVIFAEDATPFYAVVNGIKQNIEPQTNVKITGLTNQANQIRVIFSNTTIPSLNQQIYFQDMGVEATMRITNTKKGYKLRYFGEVPIATVVVDNSQWVSPYQLSEPTATSNTNFNQNNNNTTPNQSTHTTTVTTIPSTNLSTTNTSANTSTNTTSNGFGTTTTTTSENINFNTNVTLDENTTNIGFNTQINETVTPNGTGENISIGMNVGGFGFNMNVDVNETGFGTGQNSNESFNTNINTTVPNTGFGTQINEVQTNTSFHTTSNTTATSNQHTNFATDNTIQTNATPIYYVDGYSGAVGCAMPQSNIDNAKKMISNESFSSDKMNAAKMAIKNKCLTTQQVIELTSLFSYEDDKLEFVKHAYQYTYDVDNYYLLNNSFSFSESKSALTKFLLSK